MKNIKFILASISAIPLITTPILSSCNQQPKTISHKFSFHGTNCKIEGKEDFYRDILESEKNVQFTIVADENFNLPQSITGGVTYDSETGIITINEIKADITVTAEAIPYQYVVSSEDQWLTISNPVAVFGQKYETTLELTGITGGVILDNKEYTEVKVNGIKLPSEDYTYSKEQYSDTKATLSIESQYITGDITINVDYGFRISSPQHEGITFSNPIAISNVDYSTGITASEGTTLPDKLERIDVAGQELTDGQYTYQKKSNDNEFDAELKISAEFIKGPIRIWIDVENFYDVVAEPYETYGFNLSQNKASTHRGYHTTITFSDQAQTTERKIKKEDIKIFCGDTKETAQQITNFTYSYVIIDGNKWEGTLDIDVSLIKNKIWIKISNIVPFQWFEYTDWWNYCSAVDFCVRATTDDIGKIVKIKDNTNPEIEYEVRLIGIDHDEPSDQEGDEKVHCTFEFSQIYEGFSSTFDNTSDFNDFRETQLNKSLQENGSIYKKIPENLLNAIKEVKKTISVKNGQDWMDYIYSTKLFTTRFVEIHNLLPESIETYEYYKDGTHDKIKKNKEYWLRDIWGGMMSQSSVYYVDKDGVCVAVSKQQEFEKEHGVAPCFCI